MNYDKLSKIAEIARDDWHLFVHNIIGEVFEFRCEGRIFPSTKLGDNLIISSSVEALIRFFIHEHERVLDFITDHPTSISDQDILLLIQLYIVIEQSFIKYNFNDVYTLFFNRRLENSLREKYNLEEKKVKI